MRPLPVPSPSELSAEFATAYFDAAQAGADMRNVANVLETLRGQLGQATDPYSIWAALDEQIGCADLDRFMPALVKLEDGFQSAVVSAHVAQLQTVFARDPQEGWTEWLNAYARSFDNSGWRGLYAAQMTVRALSYSPHDDWTVEKIRQSVLAISGVRWPEAYDWFLFLSAQEFPVEYRAQFLAIAAEIQIFHFVQPGKARQFIEKASELGASLLAVRNAWGEYWTTLSDWERAREVFHQLVQAYPKHPEGYLGLGICDERTGQLVSAETQYYQAVLNAPGSAGGYRSLASLLLLPDQPKERVDPEKIETLIQPFFLRWKALNEKPATASVSVGAIFKDRKLFQTARRYLQEAIKLDPSYASSYVWLGYTDIDEAVQAETGSPTAAALYGSARDNFDIAISLNPAALDGYWGVTWLYIQQQNWVDAEVWIDRCLNVHPEWESFVRVRRAHILRQQGRLKEAEEDLLRSLAIESVNQPVLDGMSFLIDDYHAKGENDAARQLSEKWFQLSDPASAYLYYNRLGNWSYEAGDYAGAVEFYRQAIKINDNDAVLHSNLAGAIEKRRMPGLRCQELQEVIAELERASELDPATDLTGKIAAFRTELAFLRFYGEAAAALDPVVDPIRIVIDWAVMPEILVPPEHNISPETAAAVQAARTRLKEKFGFILPGVSFSDMQPAGSGKYRITFNESTSYEGSVAAGSVSSTILSRLEQVVPDHMPELLGHDDVARLLNQSKAPATQMILQNAARLTRFVGLLQRMLAHRQSIQPIELICENCSEEPAVKVNSSRETPSYNGFPRLVLKIGQTDDTAQTALENDFAAFRTALFNELGIAAPPITWTPDSTLSQHTAVLLLNEKTVSSMQNVDPGMVGACVRDCAPDLMVPELTEYYLAKLTTRYPVLIRAVRDQLNVQGITADLKRRLAKFKSIKNLAGILEEQLQDGEAVA